MKFAALTLKESQDSGGAYYLLFSNRPPSDKALPGSDCSAGVSIQYGTKPKSKVRNKGEFVPTFSGTTWKAPQKVKQSLEDGIQELRGLPLDCFERSTWKLSCGSSSAARMPSAWKRRLRP